MSRQGRSSSGPKAPEASGRGSPSRARPTSRALEQPPISRLRRPKARPRMQRASRSGNPEQQPRSHELGLEDILHGLRLNAMSAHFELRVDPAEEVHALRLNVDLALVPGAVEAAELRVRDELLSGLPRQVAVAARNVH